jgi:laccase
MLRVCFDLNHRYNVFAGEWWNDDVEHVLDEAKRTGGDVEPADANTING